MKVLVIILSLITLNAFSADFEKLGEMSNTDLNAFVKLFQYVSKGTEKIWPTGVGLFGKVSTVRVSYIDERSDLTKAMNEMVKWIRVSEEGRYSAPAGTSVTNIQGDLTQAILENPLRDAKQELKKIPAVNLAAHIQNAVDQFPGSIKVWVSGDGNGFGHCSSLIVLDQVNNEALLASSCNVE